MKRNNSGQKEKVVMLAGQRRDHLPLDAVEGTDQCAGCQRFMRLGEGQLCFTVTDEKINIAEVVGWSPGSCAHFVKLPDPFLAT